MGWLIWTGLGLFGIFLLLGIRQVRPVEKVIVERFGKYQRMLKQGFHWVIPWIDHTIAVNLTERMMDIEPQEVITKDNLNASVDLVVYYQVADSEENIKRSRYAVDDFETQIVSLSQTTARNVIGDMKFTDVNSKRNVLNKEIRVVLDKESDAWGVKVVRVEMKEIRPPEDVQDSMNKVIKAEKQKEAAKDLAVAEETKADGEKKASIKRAEGKKEAAVLEADGQAKAIVTVAKADAEKIKVVNQSIQANFKKEAQMFKKLETAERALKRGTKWVIDPKTGITAVLTEAAGVVPIKASKKE